jgi:hypothetical protein
MKIAIILSSVICTGCAAMDVDPCVYPMGKDHKPEPGEVVYGYTKAELAAMPKWCGGGRSKVITDRNGRVVGYIR